jgi:hypothetical protein
MSSSAQIDEWYAGQRSDRSPCAGRDEPPHYRIQVITFIPTTLYIHQQKNRGKRTGGGARP